MQRLQKIIGFGGAITDAVAFNYHGKAPGIIDRAALPSFRVSSSPHYNKTRAMCREGSSLLSAAAEYSSAHW